MSYFYIKKEEVKVHLIFLLILSLFYLIPYFLVGQLIVNPHDLLDSEIVYNHIIGRIYKGDIESINLSDCHYIRASDFSLGRFWLFLAV